MALDPIKTLTSYVPALVVRRIAADPRPITGPTAERFGAAVLFADIRGFTAIAETGYGVYHHSTSNPSGGADAAASHTITGTAPFALLVYGYDCDVSYAYPGGLNLGTDE